MQVYLNLWGGEGFLTCASFLAMASVGMFNDAKDSAGENMEIHYRCLDFTDSSPDDTRWRQLSAAYQKYFKFIFGDKAVNSVVQDDVTILSIANFTSPPTLEGKYHDKTKLSLGCKEHDMILNIHNGIYGKPWVGEAYHADSSFDRLYQQATGDIIIVNCGGYKGGGTAATFIPLENGYDVAGNTNAKNAVRFNVIAGPSTEFYHMTQIPNFGIYNGRVSGITKEVDLFDIPQVIERLEACAFGGAESGTHKGNIEFLRKEYQRVVSPDHDYSNLNPKFYMARFIDRIRSDASLKKVNASFIHIKPNPRVENGSYRYDCTSDAFQPDNQDHKIHITNMLNAVAIQEIVINHANSNYTGGKICTFCAANDKYTARGVFLPEDSRKLYRFIAFSVIMTKYVYSYFDDITRNGADIMMAKWALEIRRGLSAVRAIREETTEGQLNRAFANTVKKEIAKMAFSYIKPVFEIFKNVEDTSDDVDFFSKTAIDGNTDSLYTIISKIVDSIYFDEEEKIHPIDDANVIKEQTEKALAVLLTIKGQFSIDAIRGADKSGKGFLDKYQSQFPSFGSKSGFPVALWRWPAGVDKSNVETKAKEYFQEILRYTYTQIETELF